MRIVMIHGWMFNSRTWRRVSDELAAEGVQLELWPFVNQEQWEQRLADGAPDAVILGSGPEMNGFGLIMDLCRQIPKRVGVVPEIPNDFDTFGPEVRHALLGYLAKAHQGNYAMGIRYFCAALGRAVEYAAPEPVTTHGVYHPDAEQTFDDAKAYLDWLAAEQGVKVERNVVAVMFYYGSLVEQNLADVDELARMIQRHGLAPMCVFTEGVGDGQRPLPERYPWIGLVRAVGDQLAAVCNFASGRFLNRPDETILLEELNTPVFQLIRLHGVTPEEWLESPEGVGNHSLTYAISQPELAGAIEPAVLAAQTPAEPGQDRHGVREFTPVRERMETMCRRVLAWRVLRLTPNSQKRVTVVLHNPPCKGAEATVATAAGLDAFESTARLLNAMRQEGYDVGDAPTSGEALKDLILGRKAISEFRWTTVDEIARKGGDVYRMGAAEYLPYLDSLPATIKRQVNDDWGEFPGEGMVLREDGREPVLLITGVKFGKTHVMVQPKRGCYGAKCNGEVCRILHDPAISPPHHWLAVYKYIRDNSDAVVHMGSEGALEFLPGKRAGLSHQCYPEISLGELPNIYPYIMNVPGEGLLAKRRARAVLVDYLTPIHVPSPQDDQSLELAEMLAQYAKAVDMGDTERQEALRQRMTPIMTKLALTPAGYDGKNFERVVDTARRVMELSRLALCPLGLHVLSEPPEREGRAQMLASILARPGEGLPDLAAALEAAGRADDFDNRVDFIQGLLADQTLEDQAGQKLGSWSRDVAEKIGMASREIPQVIKFLEGGYIEPGLAGSLMLGKTQTLPTGRNFHAMDPTALPSAAAWEVGRGIADEILAKYMAEEGRFPESVGQNLWSMDGFKSDGEVLSQILHLIGARPRWDSRGVTIGIQTVALDELTVEIDGKPVKRPRVDVLVQTSGIVRDMLPNFLELIDQAVDAVGALDEPEDRNYVLKHNRERLAELRQDADATMGDEKLIKLAACRVFSSQPGSYGIGVGLALDASAWENDADLAEVYVNWGGFAYAGGEYGAEARQVYAGHIKNLDVAYMKQYSPEYDMVDCGCFASYQGGMAQAARTIGGRNTKLYWSANNTSGKYQVDDFQTGLKAALGAKLFNPAWLAEMKKHGYSGAAEVSGKVNNLFKWSATSKEVDKAVFDGVVERFLRDKQTMEWLRAANPYALEELTRRLLEAESRGLWLADAGDLAVVQAAALCVEGDLEEDLGQVTEEFQGAKVDVLTAKDVEKWSPGWTIN